MESTVPKRDKVMFGLDYIFRGPSGGPIQYMILQLGMKDKYNLVVSV